MKIYSFKVAPFYSAAFFKPVRDKRDYFTLLLNAVRYINIYSSITDPTGATEQLILRVGKSSRLLFSSEKKSFSVSFPFLITLKNGAYQIYYKNYGEIDSVVISELLKLLKEDSPLFGGEVFDFAEVIQDQSATRPLLWHMFRDIVFSESGYMRCDIDIENENGKLHPLHHIDVFFSSNAKVKIGLHEAMDTHSFLDLLDEETDCHFLIK
jgi:hypothetical protein